MFPKPERFTFQVRQEVPSHQEVAPPCFRLVPFALLPALPSWLQQALVRRVGFPLPLDLS